MDFIIIEFLIFIFLVIIAGYLSAAQIAFSSYGENKLEELKEQNHKLTSYFEEILKKEESFFGSIQLLYNFIMVGFIVTGFHIIYTLISNQLSSLAQKLFPFQAFLLALLITIFLMPPVVIIFCVLIPKAVGFKYSDEIANRSVRLLLVFSKVFSPPAILLSGISNLFLKPLKEKTNYSQARPSEDEILDIISDGVKSGAIDENEQEIIENILEFTDLKANEVMIPRTDIIAIDLNEKNEQNIDEILKSSHSLIPAFEETPDNIVGVVHTKDFLREYIGKKEISFRNLIRPAYFIPETKLISEVLKEMQKIGERLAIVTDEYGGTAGIITLEDVLEEIVGEIKDKSKVEISDFSKFPDGTFCILGSMDIDDFNETFNYQIPDSEEYNTVAGFIAFKTGKILSVSESFEYESLQFDLIKKTRQKMVQFKVQSKSQDFAFEKKTEENDE